MKCGHFDSHVSVTPNSVTEAVSVTGAWGLVCGLSFADVALCSLHYTHLESFFPLTEGKHRQRGRREDVRFQSSGQAP